MGNVYVVLSNATTKQKIEETEETIRKEYRFGTTETQHLVMLNEPHIYIRESLFNNYNLNYTNNIAFFVDHLRGQKYQGVSDRLSVTVG